MKDSIERAQANWSSREDQNSKLAGHTTSVLEKTARYRRALEQIRKEVETCDDPVALVIEIVNESLAE